MKEVSSSQLISTFSPHISPQYLIWERNKFTLISFGKCNVGDLSSITQTREKIKQSETKIFFKPVRFISLLLSYFSLPDLLASR
jgi:hypothetical protein